QLVGIISGTNQQQPQFASRSRRERPLPGVEQEIETLLVQRDAAVPDNDLCVRRDTEPGPRSAAVRRPPSVGVDRVEDLRHLPVRNAVAILDALRLALAANGQTRAEAQRQRP